VQVTLAPAGAITAGAQWNVDGGAWQSSAATLSGLTVGNHMVYYNSIAGWNAPANASVAITNNVTTTLTGTYAVQTGNLKITLLPASASGAEWNVDSGAWQAGGATVTALTVGSHTVAYAQIAGYIPPVSESVTISNSQTTTLTRTYIADLARPTV